MPTRRPRPGSRAGTAPRRPRALDRAQRRVRPGRDDDLVLAAGVDQDQRHTGRLVRLAQLELDPGLAQPRERLAANGSRPTRRRGERPRRAGRTATAWFAPLPPGTRSNVASETVSPGRGRRSQRATRSRLTEPTTVIVGGTRGRYPGRRVGSWATAFGRCGTSTTSTARSGGSGRRSPTRRRSRPRRGAHPARTGRRAARATSPRPTSCSTRRPRSPARTSSRARVELERGRVRRSSGGPGGGAAAFDSAFDRSPCEAGERFIAADAAHMAALAAPDRDGMLVWTSRGIELAASSDEAAYWLGPLLNNLGWAFYEAGELEAALDAFERALQRASRSAEPRADRDRPLRLRQDAPLTRPPGRCRPAARARVAWATRRARLTAGSTRSSPRTTPPSAATPTRASRPGSRSRCWTATTPRSTTRTRRPPPRSRRSST